MSFLWELQLLVVFVLFVAMICSCQGYYNRLLIIIDVNLFKSLFKRGRKRDIGF